MIVKATRTPTVGHPEIGRPGVDVNGEFLIVGTDRNWTAPKRFAVRDEGLLLFLALLKIDRYVDVRTWIESSRASVSCNVPLIPLVLSRNNE